MASEKVEKIKADLEALNVLELVELKQVLEDAWGVTAAAPIAAMGMMPGVGLAVADAGGSGAAPPAAAEKTEFDVILKDVGANKIQVIKVVRELTSLGLKEAKDLVESVPKPIKEGVSKEEAEAAKEKLAASGATVEVS